jgi:hypothetical protein
MKVRKMRLLVLMCSLITLGCNDFFGDTTKVFIPGTYIRFSEHEFGKEYDTLTIALEDETTEAYKIIRRWRYERILDGTKIEPEYKVIMTMGFYQRSKKHLWENGSGTIYVFDRKNKILRNGIIKYSKL